MKEKLSHESQTLTAKEAAALLPGMTYARLMRLSKQGEIPSIQYGAHVDSFASWI